MKKNLFTGQQPIRIPNPIHTPPHVERLNQLIVQGIQDTKGIDIILLDLSAVPDAGAQFFLVCHGNSTTHVMGIVDNIERKVLEHLGIRPSGIEGRNGRHWMLVDYFTTLVHVFSPDMRFFYNLEELWSDVPSTRF